MRLKTFFSSENLTLNLIGRAATQVPVEQDCNQNVQLEIPGLELFSESISDTFNVSQCVQGLSLNLTKDMAFYETKAGGYRLKVMYETLPNEEGKRVPKLEDPLHFWFAQVS